jgi:N-acetylmuramic acid 6-phosphate etherase
MVRPLDDDATREELIPLTESVNPASLGIDAKSAREVVETIHRDDLSAWEAVGNALGTVVALVEQTVRSFQAGGRLVYVGAGTSGRLGVLDATECPPTFGVRPQLVQGILAGGDAAMRRSVEGAEDDSDAGAREVERIGVRSQDVVCGIAASGTTPFVWGALEEASRRDATTALITSNPSWPASRERELVDYVVVLEVGPEIIAGSSRMKAGTATKMVLNMLSTAAMIRWGKVYDNLMVDLQPVNAKLRRRAVRLVERIAGTDSEGARRLLEAAAGEVKSAILMARGLDLAEARGLLDRNDGVLRRALGELG